MLEANVNERTDLALVEDVIFPSLRPACFSPDGHRNDVAIPSGDCK